ncbi:hypothetical protein I3760_15G016700 [Carya illinoinensis]|nr:hypothetical protein I3760_15G016700 [Carya illinoinensis]
MGKFLCHSGVKYPHVPLIPVRVLEWCGISSFASPKSAILAHPNSSIRMLLGFMSQWMIQVSHSLCKYRMPLATFKEILIL